jgi:hypothetical protein
MVSDTPPRMFADSPLIGELPPRQLAATLRRMGDADEGDAILASLANKRRRDQLLGLGKRILRPYEHTNHQVGNLPRPPQNSNDPVPIQHASTGGDRSLKRINIHLDRLRVFDYPGGGEHQILFTFKAQNQLPKTPEPVSFSQTYRVQQGEEAAVFGYPIFIGLSVGKQGVAFEGATINVKNRGDQLALGILDSAPFKHGLNLLSTAQPAIKPFTELSIGLARMFLQRNENRAVQDFFLGLDFADTAMAINLAIGNYIVAQVQSSTTIDWSDWHYLPSNGAIVSKQDATTSLPYNYVVFRVTRFET